MYISSNSEVPDGQETCCDSSKSLLKSTMGVFMPSPAVMIINKLIPIDWLNARLFLESIVPLLTEVYSLEIIVLLLVEVREVPEDADILEAEIVPFVVIWVVWYFVVMDIFTGSEYTIDLYQLTGVDLSRSSSFVSETSWNPTSVYYDGRSVKFDWVTASNEFFH